jgi:PAS domain-containing protein
MARLAVVNRLLQAALEHREPEELASMATAGIAELLPGRTVALVAVSEGGRLARLVSQSPPSHHPVSSRMPRGELEVLRRGEPVIVRDVEADPRTSGHATELLAGGVAAYADVAAATHDHLFGVLRVASATPHRWSPPELAGVSEVAMALALALRRRQDRAAREELVAAHEARVRQVGQQVALIEGAPDGMALFDSQGRLTFANSAFGSILQRPGSKTGLAWWALGIHRADEIARIRTVALPHLATEGWWRGEVEVLGVGERPFPIELTLIRRADQGYGCIIRDLAPERELASAVHASRSLLARITDAVPGALFRLTRSAAGTPCLEFLSAGARRLLDLPPDAPEPDLETLAKAVLADDGGHLETALEAARAGQPAAVEFASAPLPGG